MADIDAVRAALKELVNEKKCGPILIRLAWHDAGTYDASSKTGGPRGCMRFSGDKSEANFGANAGLDVARALLQPVKYVIFSLFPVLRFVFPSLLFPCSTLRLVILYLPHPC